MWIQNISMADVMSGHYRQHGDNVVLIQIVDPSMRFPAAPDTFAGVHQFKFRDIEDDVKFWHDEKIQQNQAAAIATVLKDALASGKNVVVHCVAGVSRSGAVVEAAIALGFDDLGAYRSSNRMVKHMILKALGLPYDQHEPYTENGRLFIYDDLNNKIFTS